MIKISKFEFVYIIHAIIIIFGLNLRDEYFVFRRIFKVEIIIFKPRASIIDMVRNCIIRIGECDLK